MRKVYLLFFMLLKGAHLWAQSSDSLITLDINEIVISGNKVAEQKSDIPYQIDVLLNKQITKLSPLTTADALANSGAVFVQKSQQGGGSPVIRGFEANKVLLVIDGVRMNNAIYRAGHLQNSITTDPNVMERIEVQQGAGSVIYGTDAIGGVISIFTKRPQLGDSINLKAKAAGYFRYSSANQGMTAHGRVNLGSHKWASLTSITASDFGDVRSGNKNWDNYPGFGNRNFYVERIAGRDSILTNGDPNLQKQSGYQQLDLLQKILFAPGNGNRHTLNFQSSSSSDIPRYDRLQTFIDGKPKFAEWYYGPQDRMMLSYELQKDQKRWWADLLRFTPAIQMIRESRFDRRLENDVKNSTMEDLKIYSANLDVFKETNGHEIRYGIEFVHNNLESTGTMENIVSGEKKPAVSRYPDGTYNTAGLYFSHRWEILGKNLILSDGLRFSSVSLDAKFDQRFFESDFLKVKQQSNSQNLYLGAVAGLPGGFRLNILLSTGFRNPNIDDLGKIFETNGGDLMVPNPDLRPEQIFYREGSIRKVFGKSNFVQVNAFVSSLTDAILSRPFATGGQDSTEFNGTLYRTFANVNTGKARVWGLAANSQWRISQNWIFRGNITYTKGKDLTADTPLDHIPPIYGRVSLDYEHTRWQAEAYLLFNGWKKLDDYSSSGEDNLNYATPEGTPAWQTLNLKCSLRISKSLSLQAGVENLFDLNYRPFASGINGPGRNWVFSIHVSE